jgi:hypothetical protein
MVIDTKEIFAAVPHLAKNPLLAIAVAAFSVPVALIYTATKFVAAPIESIILFGALGICVLIYSAWVVFAFKGMANVRSQENN